ncbi:MAG: hypothetical protein IAF94_10210 [Pirellulaceae bacterium]|nr:hypothetical protein [Pirellulaceae bacterium]
MLPLHLLGERRQPRQTPPIHHRPAPSCQQQAFEESAAGEVGEESMALYLRQQLAHFDSAELSSGNSDGNNVGSLKIKPLQVRRLPVLIGSRLGPQRELIPAAAGPATAEFLVNWRTRRPCGDYSRFALFDTKRPLSAAAAEARRFATGDAEYKVQCTCRPGVLCV